MPVDIAWMAQKEGCPSVAYTYNDPVVFHEYAVDTAQACRERGIANVAVTAGYINLGPRQEFFDQMDAVNMDLKSFREKFYRSLTNGHIKPVLESLEYVAHETSAWLEITTLIIPGYNDSRQEIRELARWLADHLGSEVPLHLTAFHPSGEMTQVPRTPAKILFEARQTALDEGLEYVYTGNIFSPETSHTYCPRCGALVVERETYRTQVRALDEKGHCQKCGYKIAGRF
jgi:pyruvate formate lyase activating enzyme